MPRFSVGERLLWAGSAALIMLSFLIFDRENYLSLAASLVGVSSLIFAAKGHPIGPALMVIFSLMYSAISFDVHYYGEMITYAGMTLPMSAAALVSWLRHPYRGGRSEVEVAQLRRQEWVFMWIITLAVTAAFFFILRALGTARLLPSTLSVSTSFAAVYLTWRRSPFYALAYAANDLVLIVLWSLASSSDPCCLSVVVCFCAFFANDLYGFVSWRRMAARQGKAQ